MLMVISIPSVARWYTVYLQNFATKNFRETPRGHPVQKLFPVNGTTK